ncbi:MAG: hypothetical protein OEZ22_01815 [Spirochaetia bacterium]|nr:hypothetical protein [Spirochaetia bacterium]
MTKTREKESFLSKWAVPEYLAPKDSVLYYRELILFWILFVWTIFVPFGLFGIINSIKQEDYIGLFNRIFFSISVILLLFFRRHITIKMRTFFTLLLFLFSSINITFFSKQLIAGVSMLYVFTVFSSILADKKGLMISYIACFFYSLALVLLINNNYFNQTFNTINTIENSLRIGVGIFLANLILTLPVASLVKALFFFLENKKN